MPQTGYGVSRRAFVKSGGVTLFSLGLEPLFLTRAAYALDDRAGAGGRPVLVCLFLRGGVDGLHMVVPYGDAIYYRERPRIAVPRSDVVDLDGHFGLHPRLAPLETWWNTGALAVVHAIGSPDPTRSHFDAQDYVETGTPGVKTTPDGWANRYCANARAHDSTPFRAVAFGAQLPRILAGTAPSLAIDDLRTSGLRATRSDARQRLTAAFAALSDRAPTGFLASSAAEGFAALETLRRVDRARSAPAKGADYPSGRLGRSLRQIAQLIRADVGLEIAFADASGWDTHVHQGASQGLLAARLDELGHALDAFARDLGGQLRDVVVLTISEFGRTISENGSGGTDHGRATATLVLGGPVHGRQVLGRWPGLDPQARDAGRDLAVTTDFRDLFGELLVRHLGAHDLAAVFPGRQIPAAAFPGAIRG